MYFRVYQVFDGNLLNYHYFMALFSKVVQTKTDDPRGRLARLIKFIVGEPKELIKHRIQLPCDHGYHTAVSLFEKPMKISERYNNHIEGR